MPYYRRDRRTQVKTQVDKMRISRALRENFSESTDTTHEPVDHVLAWCEKDTPKKRQVSRAVQNTLFLPNNKARSHIISAELQIMPPSTSQVRSYMSPTSLSTSFFQKFYSKIKKFTSLPKTGDVFSTEIIPLKEDSGKTP